MEKIRQKIKTKEFKNVMYAVCIAALLGWIVFRFTAIGSENALAVFNQSRYAADVGAPVYAIEMKRESGILREPIEVKNNRALVSSARVGKLRSGQHVGDGKIVSVSKDIDLNTGMHVVQTKNVDDGLQYALYQTDGYFVPLYAINGDTVMISENGIATPRKISIVRQDAQNALIDGLKDGDVVVLSKVDAGAKVQIKK